jgi:hypothetical protein
MDGEAALLAQFALVQEWVLGIAAAVLFIHFWRRMVHYLMPQ